MTTVTCRVTLWYLACLDMPLAALIVCRDDNAVQVLHQVLASRGIEAEHCDDAEIAAARLAEQRYAMLILDCEEEAAALNLLITTRESAVNKAALVVAMVDARNEIRDLFERGVNFLMYKPVSVERADECLHAAWSLLPRDQRRKERIHVSTQASITFATTEDSPVPLLNVSEDGISIHSQNKMPPPCRVYFQFTLPGQPVAVRLSAEVIWQDWRGRVGLHFAHVPQASRKILDDWLRKNPNRAREKNKPSPANVERFILASPEPRIPAPTPVAVASEDERRAQARRACRLGVNVYRPEGSVLQHCTLTDVSGGGCYIETTVPLAVGTRLEIEVRTQDWKLRIQGKVRSMHLGFGMGVEFRGKTPEDKEQVRQLLACLDAQVNIPAESEKQRD
jgi:DNA-binding NarL/FixJ family response regulator